MSSAILNMQSAIELRERELAGERDFVREFEDGADKICRKLADDLEAVDRRNGIEPYDYSVLRGANDDDDLRCSTVECDGRVTEEGDQCVDCRAREAYWRGQCNDYGRREVANRMSRADIEDAYSDPTDAAKRESLLRKIA